jgi:hypothetical protein
MVLIHIFLGQAMQEDIIIMALETQVILDLYFMN